MQQDGDEKKDISLFKLNTNKQWEKLSNAKKTLGESFFYTILMNYSLYAFNTLEYKEEWDKQGDEETCWLKGLFHKNDGYQTPVVLNPMRTTGNINVNRENNLAKDRLISLFFNEKERKNSIFTTINDITSVTAISIKLNINGVKEKFDSLIKDWEKEKKENFNSEFIEELKATIITEWQNKYKFKAASDNDEEYELASLYLTYKTISISLTYRSQLKYSIGKIQDKEQSLSNSVPMITDLIKELDNENSHITFKLRQTIAFLKFRHFKTENKELIINIYEFSKLVESKINNKWKYIDFVPAPFFNTEIILENKLNKERFTFSKLSSGERQLIYSASSILYHIRNLNSIKGNLRKIKYKSLNIMLDEIELYFHPEFQRRYIDYLIRCINGINLQEIENINIIIATHSPFILSDIPESNVLFLNEGKSHQGISETFGANIHTLYKNNFFIEGMPIGEFSKNKIKTLFEKTRKIKEPNSDLYNEIKLVGEQILKTQLLKLYNQNASNDLIKRIIVLEKECHLLKEKNNDKN